MAIRYEAPQPFAPGISEGAGRAEVETRNNPVVYGAGSDTIRMAVSGAERQADRAERSAERRDRSSAANMALAQRQTESDYGNAQRALIADGEIENRQTEFERENALRVGQAQMEERARLNEITARGQVQGMLMQQELSLQEQQKMARLQTQMAYVANAPGLNEQERRDIMLEMKTGIDPLKRRQEMALARQQEQRAALYEQEAALQARVAAKNAALDAKSLGDRTHYIMDPIIQQQVEAEIGPITQEEIQQYGQNAPRMHAERVRREVMKRGGLMGAMVQTGYDQRERPQYAELTPPKAAGEGKAEKPVDLAKAAKDAQAEAEIMFPDDQLDDMGKLKPSAATIAKRNGYAQEAYRMLRGAAQQQAAQGGSTPQSGESAGGQPAEKTAKEKTPYTRQSPETMDRQQQDQEAKFQQARGAILNRGDLPEATRQRAAMAVDGMADLMAAHGSYQRMPEAVRTTYDKYRELVKSLPEAPPKQAAQPAAQPAARPGLPTGRMPSGGIRWGAHPRS